MAGTNSISIASKSRAAKQPPVMRRCIRCGKDKPLESSYTKNREWQQLLCRDVICKDCASLVKTKRQVRQYYWDNNRGWDQKIWKSSQKKAIRVLAANKEYNQANEQQKNRILQSYTAKQCTSSTTLGIMYRYQSHEDKNGNIISYEDALKKGIVEQKDGDSGQRIFSKEFNGYYSEEDLQYLHDYYDQLQTDYDLDNISRRDYAKKVAVASLQASRAQSMFSQGKVSAADVKDAMNLFDMLSKSADFAACRRKPGDMSGLTCWAQTTMYLQQNGFLKKNPYHFQKDQVDYMIDDLHHIVKAVGLDSK